MTLDVAKQTVDQHLRQNTYPGRGIVIGRNQNDEWFQVYWLMGRSANSRNRVLTATEHDVHTEAADTSKLEDPSLIIYSAMRDYQGCYIVTNGAHTDTIYEGLCAKKSFEQSLQTEYHEPDPPNHTPRISGLLDIRTPMPSVQLSIIKAVPGNADESERLFFEYDAIEAGTGMGLTTYEGDGNPIPSFEGEPRVFPIDGSAAEIANFYWSALNAENRVSLVVRQIFPETGTYASVILNQYHKV